MIGYVIVHCTLELYNRRELREVGLLRGEWVCEVGLLGRGGCGERVWMGMCRHV